jgi:hypothetical protein
MKIYFFGGEHHFIDSIYESGFDGVLFLYNAISPDYFTTLISHKDKLKKDFSYMIALRPYAMSPQYLSMINRTISDIIDGRLEINLISGHPKEIERPYNSFVGDINDWSSKIEKSKYLIEYLEALSQLADRCKHPEKDIPNAYVSTTNEFVLEAANKHGHKMIIPYPTHNQWKKDGTYERIGEKFPISTENILVSFAPIITFPDESHLRKPSYNTSDTIFVTSEELVEKLNDLKNEGIYGILLASWEDTRSDILRFVKENKEFI